MVGNTQTSHEFVCNHLSHKQAFDLYNSTFKQVNAFIVACDCKRRHNLHGSSMTYGEILFESFVKSLDLLHIKPGSVFCDLGSGAGKAVVTAMLNFPFAEVYGIELLDDLVELSQNVLMDVKKKTLKKTPFQSFPTHAEIIHGNIFSYDVSGADVVFVASTCFDEPQVKKMADQLSRLKKGAYAVTLTKSLGSHKLPVIHELKLPMSWGESTVIIQEKV